MKSNRRQVMVLHCMAYPSLNDDRQGYAAVCIDLSLVTWRPTKREAKQSLHEAIHGYLETISEFAAREDPSEWKHLLYRPMPFWPYWITYYLFYVLNQLPRIPKAGSRTQVFTRQVPTPLSTAAA